MSKNDPTTQMLAMIGVMNAIMPDGQKLAQQMEINRLQNDISAVIALHQQYMMEMKRRLQKAQKDAHAQAQAVRKLMNNKNDRIINLETKVRLLEQENLELRRAINDNDDEKPAVRIQYASPIPKRSLG